MVERKCIICAKKIKKNSVWCNRQQTIIHRKCWLKFRPSQDRCFDFMFCGDRAAAKKNELRLTPCDDFSEDSPAEFETKVSEI